jgi:hypothetical protein
MNRRKTMKSFVTAVFCGALIFCSSAMGDPRNKKTILTFGEAVELPGMVLAPGTYVFKVPDFNYRHVIQVFTADERRLIGTVIAIASEREQTTDRTALRFRERPRGQPELQRWFYPQEKTGHELIFQP